MTATRRSRRVQGRGTDAAGSTSIWRLSGNVFEDLERAPEVGHNDFSKAKRNPYPKRVTGQVTIRLDAITLGCFRALAEKTEIPQRTLMQLYLRERAATGKRPSLRWRAPR